MSMRDIQVENPHRITHAYVQTIEGGIDEIMPLFCPVRETEWCENWNPKKVYSYSGLVEKNCMFITSHGETDVVWVVTDYDVKKGYVKMIYHIPGLLVTILEVQLTPITENQTTAVVSYTKTSLSPSGREALREFTTENYAITMDSWEKAMNHFLKTGKMLTGLPNF